MQLSPIRRSTLSWITGKEYMQVNETFKICRFFKIPHFPHTRNLMDRCTRQRMRPAIKLKRSDATEPRAVEDRMKSDENEVSFPRKASLPAVRVCKLSERCNFDNPEIRRRESVFPFKFRSRDLATEPERKRSMKITIPQVTLFAFCVAQRFTRQPLKTDDPHVTHDEGVEVEDDRVNYCTEDVDEYYLFHERILQYIFVKDMQHVQFYNESFLSRSNLTKNIRATLFDWMIKVQQYLRMRSESLHLACTFVDQYTFRRKIEKTDYQLAGITALFLAAKVNERFPPLLEALCYLTENSYLPHQVLAFEMKMLKALDFQVNPPLPHHFLGVAILACKDLDRSTLEKVELFSLYLYDLGLTEVELAGRSSSMCCSATVYLARRVFLSDPHIPSHSSPPQSDDSTQAVHLSPTSGCWSASGESDMTPPAFWTPDLIAHTGQKEGTSLRLTAAVYIRVLLRLQQYLRSRSCNSDIKSAADSCDIHEAAFLKYSNRQYGGIARLPLITTFNYKVLLEEWSAA